MKTISRSIGLHIGTLLVLGCLLIRADMLAQGRPTEVEGSWIAEAMERDGRQMPPEAFATMQFVFRGNTLSHRGLVSPDRTDQGPFSIDGTAVPKRLDFNVPDGSTIRAIYELKDGKLTLYFHRKGVQRPTAFRQTFEGGTILLIFKKRT